MRPTIPALLALMIGPVATLAAAEAMREVSGDLTYLQRIALPPGAEVTVTALGPRDVRLGEMRFVTAGEQVPLPFVVAVPETAAVRIVASIGGESAPAWAGGPVAIGPGMTAAGTIILTPGGLPIAMTCGDMAITARFDGAGMEIATPRGDIRLMPAPAASGARFEAEGDPSTWFWSKGEAATLSLQGEEYPECRPMGARWVARSNEPFWAVTVEGEQAVLTTPEGTGAAIALQAPVWRDGAVEWASADGAVLLRVADRLCRDTMTGMPYPETVTLITPEQERQGCGGEPRSLLTGEEWVIEDIGEKGIIDNARPTMTFRTDGSLGGSGGCNRYNARYDLTGEGLTIGPAAATMMACPRAVMTLEQAMFRAMAGVVRFDIDMTGALLLLGAEGERLITARR
jgi:heat shock protein HslJ